TLGHAAGDQFAVAFFPLDADGLSAGIASREQQRTTAGERIQYEAGREWLAAPAHDAFGYGRLMAESVGECLRAAGLDQRWELWTAEAAPTEDVDEHEIPAPRAGGRRVHVGSMPGQHAVVR